MKRDDSLKKYPHINLVSVVPSQGYPEFKLPAYSKWLAGVFFLDVTNSRTTIQPGDGFKLFSSPRTAGLGGWTPDASRPPIG